MSVFGNLNDFLESIFTPQSQRSESAQIYIEKLYETIWYKELALHIIAEKIATVMSNVEWKTMVKGTPKNGENWYTFNYEPNPNQSGAEFKKELARKLVYDRECLVVEIGGHFYIADDFNKVYPTMGVGEVTFNDVTVNILEESVSVQGNFDKKNSIYMHYQNSSVEQWMNNLTELYAELISNTTVAGSSKVKYALNIDTTAAKGLNIDYTEVTKQLINEDFKALASDNNVIVPLYNGYELKQLNAGNNLAQNASIANKSINEQLEVFISDVAKAYGMPLDVALGKESDEDYISYMTFCVDPLYNIIERAFNRRFYGKMNIYKGMRFEINTRNTRHFEILRAGSAFSQLISSGVESINDIRAMLDQELIDPEIGDKHWITRNYAVVGSFLEEQAEVANKEASGESVSATGGGLK